MLTLFFKLFYMLAVIGRVCVGKLGKSFEKYVFVGYKHWRSYCFIALIVSELCAVTTKFFFCTLAGAFFLYVSNKVTLQAVGAALV